jgi:hypothetical protein
MVAEWQPITVSELASLAEQLRDGTLPQSHLRDLRVQMAIDLLTTPGAMNGQFDTGSGTHLDAEDRQDGVPTEKPNT